MYVKRQYLWLVMLILATGCFKKPDQEKMAIQITVSAVPVYNGTSSSYLVASGACKGNTSIIFTYSSSLTPVQTVEAQCTNDAVTVNLPIQSGSSNQIFSVSAYGHLQNKKSSPFIITVNYNPAPKPVAGSTINVAGGKASGASASTWDVAGEYFGGTQIQTSPGAIHRSGLSGVLDP